MSGIELGPCIVMYEDVFDGKDFLRHLIEEADDEHGFISWTQSTVGDGEVDERRTSMGCSINALSEAGEYSETLAPRMKILIDEWGAMHSQLDDIVWGYRKSYDLKLHGDNGYQVLRYQEGQEYQAHHDHGPGNARVLSLVAFLNDGFEGGQLVFPTFDVTVQPKAGSAVLFPSNFPYQHIAKPVGADAAKYVIVTWFE